MTQFIRVDLRTLSKDTRALLRWVARDECEMDDEERADTDLDALMDVDAHLLRRVVKKLGRMRFRVTPEEAECLQQLIYSVGDRLGAENLKDVDALMEGDDEAFMEPYDYLPDQEGSDRDKQGKELDRLLEALDKDRRRTERRAS